MRKYIIVALSIVIVIISGEQVYAGVIADAPPLITGLTKILDFLLVILGMLAILGMIIAGLMYFLAGGDKRQVILAKSTFRNVIVGVIIALGSMVLVFTIGKLLS